jgi:hypothetical protein
LNRSEAWFACPDLAEFSRRWIPDPELAMRVIQPYEEPKLLH